MDFQFTDEQNMVRELARGILAKEVAADRVKAAEQTASWHDARLWSTLADAGLLGIAIEENHGGMGLGFLGLCSLLEEVGRVVAPVHVLPALVLAGLPIAELGTAEQKNRWLTGIATGESLLTGAFGACTDVARLPVVAKRAGNGWALSGTTALTPAADLAARVLIPARTETGLGIFLVDPRDDGVKLARHRTSRGEPLFDVWLDGVAVESADVLGGNAAIESSAMERIDAQATIATCATQVGVSQRALELTSSYVRERIQFGVPIGSFQAVQHRLADAYIDVESMRWVMWRAAWRLSRSEEVRREVAVAKFWAAEGGARIAASAQHVHGGIGVDVDYPIHRYFLWSKALELSFGNATQHLVTLGRDMSATPPSLAR
jgi:alkylation response protein AidB-like acyl-CoA dehydrogenase